MPRKLCVDIGPFIGGNDGSNGSGVSWTPIGLLFGCATPSGFPRSQVRSSLSPNTWQLAQDESPWELSVASYRKRRPRVTLGGSGLNIDTCATSLRVWVLT